MKCVPLRRLPELLPQIFRGTMKNPKNINDNSASSATFYEGQSALGQKVDAPKAWFETGARLSTALGHDLFGNLPFEIIGVMLSRIDRSRSISEADIAYYTKRSLPVVQRYTSVLEVAGHIAEMSRGDAQQGRVLQLTDHCLTAIRSSWLP
jgi:hypothetical protein